MKEKLITVTRDELEQVILQEALRTRRMLFDIELEEYFEPPKPKESRFYKKYVLLSKADWEKLLKQIEYILVDCQQAKDIIKIMEPVFREYRTQYEQEHTKQDPKQSDDFDEYIKMVTTSYDAEEFERAEELFEKSFNLGESDEELEL